MHHDVSPFMKAYVKNYISIYDSCLSSFVDTECAPCRTECLEHSDDSFPLVLDLISNLPPCSCSFPSHEQEVPVTMRFPISFRHFAIMFLLPLSRRIDKFQSRRGSQSLRRHVPFPG